MTEQAPARPRKGRARPAGGTAGDGKAQAGKAGGGRAGLPDWLEPQLATLTRDTFSDPAWLFERKLDGERCLAYCTGPGIRLVTRNRKEVATNYPEIVGALGEQRGGDLIVDGEIVAFDGDRTSFALLQQRIHVARPQRGLLERVPVYFYIFDVLYAEGRDVRGEPLRERKRLLCGLLPFRDPLRYTEHTERDGEACFAEACRRGWEGLIAKRADAPYRPGRSRDWLKFKCESGQEFVVGGYTDPQRSRVGLGALLLGYYDPDGRLVYAGKVGTGFDQRELRSLHRELAGLERPDPPFGRGDLPRSGGPRAGVPRAGVHWAEPCLVAEVSFSEWTRDGQLRHPRYRGLRRDKPARDVVRETPR